MSCYESYAHAKTLLRYHLIFSTKYRRKCLSGPVKKFIMDKIEELAQGQNFRIEIQEIDPSMFDHIHILVRIDPCESISNVVHRLKQMTTYYVWRDPVCSAYLSKYYWSGKHLLWTRGYFASTVGNVSEKTLSAYIEAQG